MQTLRKKTSPLKYRNEPARFFGDGVMFKAKLIGILEVGEARGDRMCQEALQDLKMAIRAAGEHKQRITIHVTIDGLRLRDEKTGDSLYHHPVHKISFIAQDMTDSRAFGYIFGSPDSGHRFFGIKTDKAASQVVLAMRDLFQVVFELKKKEIELARQHIQNKITSHEHQQVAMAVKNSILSSYKNSNNSVSEASKSATASSKAEKSPESVADLVDLEQELSSIQRGITQMERITPSEGPPSTKSMLDGDDPFGDSFTPFPSILPPPESRRQQKQQHHQQQQQQQHHGPAQKIDDTMVELSSIITSSTPPIPFIDGATSTGGSANESWLNSPPMSSVFEDNNNKFQDEFSQSPKQPSFEESFTPSQNKSTIMDAFTDLDPLGTGKTRPYVDKKYFFQDLKNPPKKLLKELSSSGQDSVFDVTFFGDGGNETQSTVKNSSIISIESSLLGSRDDKSEDSKRDPFDDGEFSKLSIDPFDALFAASSASPKQAMLPETKTQQQPLEETEKSKLEEKKSNDSGSGSTGSGVFNGPLQVSLPPESWSGSFNSQKRLERQNSDGSSPASNCSTSRSRPNVFKQNTVDVFSKKMKPPNLFGQKFTKRDSNGINMRRLQESDSLSENETAEPPMPPPRPDSSSHIEPPPLPPKKQFNDNFVIRPSSITSQSKDSTRYDYISNRMKQLNENAPPLPLPSRKVGRTETSFPGPGRPSKKSGDDDDYLTPIQGQTDIPTILPPPQQRKDTKRGPRKSDTDPKNLDAPTPPVSAKPPSAEFSDITLSQLLTLGIDDLASKLNVPVSKLNTMTIVELTTYLANFIEKSKQKAFPDDTPVDSPVFKVNFDEGNDATFVAKFDDSFGQEDDSQTFVANFDNFNSQPVAITSYSARPSSSSVPNVPPADKYAVFREIIDNDMLQTDPSEEPSESNHSLDFQREVESEMSRLSPRPGSTTMEQFSSSPLTLPTAKIDTKITDAISNAKDRYAALRDIILVENLFDKTALPSQASMPESNISDEFTGDEATDNFGYENVEPNVQESSPTINITESVEDHFIEDDIPELDQQKNQQSLLSTSNKDDFEIDEYMKKAISNLSLDSKDRLSPAVNKSPAPGSSISPNPNKVPTPTCKTPVENLLSRKPLTVFSDMSTSPIPPSKSPTTLVDQRRLESPGRQEPSSKSPTPMPEIKEDVATGSGFSDAEVEDREKTATPPAPTKELKPVEAESWAVFDQNPELEADKKELSTTPTNKQPVPNPSQQAPPKEGIESPYSSDGKNEWKQKEFGNKRWPKGHTSSSSRDVSPWDEDGPPPDYRRRPHHVSHAQHHPNDRYTRPAPPIRHHGRRINSCDEDYEYEDEIMDRRTRNRISKGPMHRSKEILDSEHLGWYHTPEQHQQWSPAEDEEDERVERNRSFDRNAYERTTYGPPYEKRGPYDRRDYKGYVDKRKYYRGRNDYDYEYDSYLDSQYEAPPPPRSGKLRGKEYDEYEQNFERGARESRSAREYFYDRERKSFDRESNESYDSGRARRSMGSGELYGSFEGRSAEYRADRERYLAQTRSLRRGQRPRSRNEEEQDSEGEIVSMQRKGVVDTGSLQRGSSAVGIDKRPKPLQMSMDDDVWGSKPWKRPSSATEPAERSARYPVDQRRNIAMTNPLSGSDGEKDKRFRKKPRSKGKEADPRNYSSLRFSQQRRDYYEYEDQDPDEQENQTSPRLAHEPESTAYYSRRQHFKSTTPRSESRSFSETLKSSRYGGFEDDEDDYDDPKSADGGRRGFKKSSSRDMYLDDPKERFTGKFGSSHFDNENDPPLPPTSAKVSQKPRPEFNFQGFPNQSSSKFNFDDGNGFESDFNSPPKNQQPSQQQLQPQQPKNFRFSNDFSDKDSPRQRNIQQQQQQQQQISQQKPQNFEVDFNSNNNNNNNGNSEGPATQQKLRFNENVSVSKFDADFSSQQMFEDDFAKSELTFEAEDQWNPELPMSGTSISTTTTTTIQSSMKKLNSSVKARPDIKKSESVNIFARKANDPFEDDDFFSSGGGQQQGSNGSNSKNGKNGMQDPFQWNKNNFANFEDNI